jgi:dCMP deaminase
MLTNARIKRFVTFGNYRDDAFKELFREAGIKVEIREKPSPDITFID